MQQLCVCEKANNQIVERGENWGRMLTDSCPMAGLHLQSMFCEQGFAQSKQCRDTVRDWRAFSVAWAALQSWKLDLNSAKLLLSDRPYACWKHRVCWSIWQPLETHSWPFVKVSLLCLCCSGAGISERLRVCVCVFVWYVSTVTHSPAACHENTF